MRGRNRPKGPNPLTRSYESNGPDVKIRGTAQHIADKYAQLARDAQAAGDPVAAENYFQHGEHYFRIVSGAQEQTRPANTGGYASRSYEDDMDEGDDEGQGNGSGQNGHAYNGYDDSDLGQQPQPYEMRQDTNQDSRQQGRDRFQNRDQRRFDNNGRQDYRRQDQPRQDYQRPDSQRQDSQRQDSQRQDYQRPDYRQDRQDNRQENRQENRQDGRQDYGRQDYRQDRQDNRQESRQENRQDNRGDQNRYESGRSDTGRPDTRQPENRQDVRQDVRSDERQPRRAETRNEAAPRSETPRQAEPAPRRERRREAVAAPVTAEDPASLPAFLMAPTRPVAATTPVEQPSVPAVETAAEEAPVKPRRRRRPRFDGIASEEGEARTPAEDAPTE
ncbi:DUF4167 domain-containing protein [Methylobacterium sp. J-077]|uniref:DUF4167 domain-containing protein n=1 Tax=Methylobacterium sp. J-077 TaxID=2836656 RepID=UPI001FBADEC7|nr:DUF4167 domain-containing protein [Methylobacterium sp. J-077]MCJ2126268.1 DUF4167 domain-containing protein [Methylobacterium sp. J-077]